jgi:ABC-2 type transport system permease protein
MTALAQVSASTASARVVATLRVLLVESRMEFLRLLRSPAFSVPIISFPVMFYILFALVMGPPDPTGGIARHLLATFTTFGVMAPGLFGLGVSLAIERERGLLELKRALPVPAGVYLGAKLVMAAVFAAIVSGVLMILAATAGQVVLEVLQALKLLGLAILGVLPFCSLGLLIGTLAKGQAAAAIVNLVYLPMSFLSGVLIPLSALPHALARLAPIWPCYHLAQIALHILDTDEGTDLGLHVAVVAAEGILFFVLAQRRLSRLR